jgi:hypothetical protein
VARSQEWCFLKNLSCKEVIEFINDRNQNMVFERFHISKEKIVVDKESISNFEKFDTLICRGHYLRKDKTNWFDFSIFFMVEENYFMISVNTYVYRNNLLKLALLVKSLLDYFKPDCFIQTEDDPYNEISREPGRINKLVLINNKTGKWTSYGVEELLKLPYNEED